MNSLTLAELKNKGMDWWNKCNKRQGRCDWCGSKGFCCTRRMYWSDTSNGCDGTFGGATRHECTLDPSNFNY